jgi:hypothetical protein
VVFGTDYAYVSVTGNKDNTSSSITFSVSKNAEKKEETSSVEPVNLKISDFIFLRVSVNKNGVCRFGYSLDGKDFIMFKEDFIAKPGKWVGAKLGLFATCSTRTNDTGYAEIDWFMMEKKD